MATGEGGAEETIPPLRKRKPNNGPLYYRPEDTEALLALLVTLPEEEALARARIQNRRAPGWLPGECLIHMMRRAGRLRDRRAYRHWYDLVSERIRRALPRPASKRRADSTELEIAEVAFHRFLRLLGPDLAGYEERLDIWEARFDLAVANLRRDALEKVLPAEDEPNTVEIGDDPALAKEVEEAAGAFDPFDPARINEEDFRSRVWEAIDALPTEQNRILTMMAQGIPFGTGAEGEKSISGILRMQPRTVNNHKRRAFEAVRKALEGDDA
jgi:ribosomal protein L39E